MKAIILNTAYADNGGTRRDAGETVTIGEGASEIVTEFAQALVAAGSADEAPAPRSRARVQPDATSNESE